MKKTALKPTITAIAILLLLLKGPMSKSIELSNIYSIIISVAVSLFVICLIILDSWDDRHIKSIDKLDSPLLIKYRALSVLVVLLFTFETILVLLKRNTYGIRLIQIFLLIIAFLVLWIQGRFAQGTQTKFSAKEIVIYLILILLMCSYGWFLQNILV